MRLKDFEITFSEKNPNYMKHSNLYYNTLRKIFLLLLVLHTISINSVANAIQARSVSPELLKQNDVVAIVAPAWWDHNEKIIIEETIKTFQDWGVEVAVGESIGVHNGQFSGADDLRLAD